VVTGLSNGTGLYLAAIHDATMLADSNTSYFRKFQAIAFDGEPTLRISDRSIPVTGFETGKSGLLSCLNSTEEILKGFIQPSQNILQYLRMDLFELRESVFNFRKLLILTGVQYKLTEFFVSRYPVFQSRVVKPTTKAELRIDSLGLISCRVQSVFIGPQHYFKYTTKTAGNVISNQESI
jgi:hypothetical protein